MEKPKDVAIAVEEGEVQSDGLEITSIGSPYRGPWEKKYWSSSRGKDRYPYPVGYHAVRSHNGNTCQIEIHEGPKGPLFMITSADGHSCSGQTPDIAWGKFQKKNCPRTKTWHGKRLSCVIDGVEFFGFKNSFVQRLLRELVADISGTVERSVLPSSFSNGDCGRKHDNRRPDACVDRDLQPVLQTTQVPKKRSRKKEVTNSKPVGRNALKKPRSTNDMYHNKESFVPPSSSKGRNDLHKSQDALQPSLNLHSKTIERKDGYFLSQDVSLSECIDFSDHLVEGSVVAHGVTNSSIEEEKPLDRSKGCRFTEVEYKAGDAPELKSSPLCAPDTLNCVQDNPMQSSPTTHDERNYSLNEDFTTDNNVIFGGVVADSHAEVEMTLNLNGRTGKDIDSVGQEITEAMMTVLLPQAIPLLKQVPGKEQVSIRHSGTLKLRVNLQDEQKETSHLMKPSSPGVPTFENSRSVVLDHFEVDQQQAISSCNIMEADEPSIDKDINLPRLQKEPVVEDAQNESLVSHVENRNSKNILFNEANMGVDKMLPDRDVCMSESVVDCRSSGKQVFSEKERVVCPNLDEDSAIAEIHHMENDLKIDSEGTEGANDANKRGMSSIMQLSKKDVPGKLETGKTGLTVQVPNKVYARKKFSKGAPSTKKFEGPFSESIICRNFVDDRVPKQHHTVETLLPSEISQIKSSDDDPRKENLVCAKDMLEEQSCDLPIMPQNSRESSASALCMYIDPSTLRMSKSEAKSSKELDDQVHLVEFTSSVASQKQEINCCEYTSSIIKEAKVSTDSKLETDVESHNELADTFNLVGCYFHHLPILSVLLRKTGNDIYVCVSCGFLVDKKRTLFIYNITVQEPRMGKPAVVGYTSVMLPFLKDNFSREIAMESSCVLNPDGQCLVLLDIIKTPYCREGRTDCLCSTCTSHCLEESAVKIVKVKPGYVCIVAKLKIDDSVQCILVCEPNHLIAVGESGKLHLWEMNSTWSAHVEEYIIPMNDCVYPCFVEIKRISNRSPLVIGHNGYGEFGIWDFHKRAFVSKISVPRTSIHCFFPINSFGWQTNGSVSKDTDLEPINAATRSLVSKHSENNFFLPSEGEDTAIWLLVSTVSNSDAQHNCISSDVQINPVRLWRLALLVKNMVILGSPVDPRAAAIGASSGYGIVGTFDGIVYAWELSSGNKLGTLHHFKGGTVSTIATDDSGSQALAVAGNGPDGGQLLVYLHSREDAVNQ